MKKIICILGLALLLTGCSTNSVKVEDNIESVPNEVNSIIDSNEKATYIDDDIKQVIRDINNLREKYKDGMDENEYDNESPYVDINNPGIKEIKFNNEMFNDKDYFKELVEILDKDVAEGLKEHIIKMKNKKIEENEIILRKIGRVVIYTENKGEDIDNYTSIKVDFSDIKDEDYKALFNEVSGDKYVLDNIIIGDKLNMIDFINLNNAYNLTDYDYNYLSIRYNMFLEEKDIKKVNILMQGKNESNIEDDDIDVFNNLLNTLELNQEDKSLLLKNYKDIFQKKSNNKEIALEDYKVLINTTKGNAYSRNDKRLVYFSIEKI